MSNEITLTPADPTVWAKCPNCTKTGRGTVTGKYFAKAYPRRFKQYTYEDVLRGEVCDNCGTDMQFLYEVK